VIDEAIRMYLSGTGLYAIQRMTGVAPSTLYKALQLRGIKKRGQPKFTGVIDREMKMVRLRHEGESYGKIAKKFNITRQRAHQLVKRGLERLGEV
jgi:hypothetical protein